MPPRRKALAAGLAIFALGIAIGATGTTFSAFTSTTANPSNSFSSAADWTAPVISAGAVGKSAGGTPAGGRPGAVKQNATFYAYANVAADTGNPASGIASVKANLTNLNGQSAATLTSTGGPWTVDGTTYNYRSSLLTANLAAGNSTFNTSITAPDVAANSTPFPFSVKIDNTVPTTSAVAAANGTGTVGVPDRNDQITLTYSEAIDPYTAIPATAWNGTTPANVVVRLINGGAANDSMQIWNTAQTTQLNLGSINLGSRNYSTATITYGATGTASTIQQSADGLTITITLGTASATATAGGAASLIWTPVAALTDIAANAMSTATRTEAGAADVDF